MAIGSLSCAVCCVATISCPMILIIGTAVGNHNHPLLPRYSCVSIIRITLYTEDGLSIVDVQYMYSVYTCFQLKCPICLFSVVVGSVAKQNVEVLSMPPESSGIQARMLGKLKSLRMVMQQECCTSLHIRLR